MRPYSASSLSLLVALYTPSFTLADIPTISIPTTGNASVTHYDLPLGGYIASCGCGGNGSYYPTAALSQAAYGSSIGSGPGCGMCFNVSLVSAFIATPPFELPEANRPWVVVKITDKCPAPVLYDPDRTWCGATSNQPNMAGVYVHFDLSSPSPSIPLSFFPSPPANYGYNDFGSWRATYATVSCVHWAGYRNETASIVDPSLKGVSSACCPVDPLITNNTCKATSLVVGGAVRGNEMNILYVGVAILLAGFFLSSG